MKTIVNRSTLITIRVMGIVFLLGLIIPTLNWVFIFSTFISIENILENEFLFRLNILFQVVTSLCIVALGLCLHRILKQVHAGLSFASFVFKMFEAALSLVIALIYQILFSTFKAGLIEASVLRGVIGEYISYTAFFGIFLGISMLIFSVLFYKSALIPKWLAIVGMASYVLVIVYDGSSILISKTYLVLQILGSAPVCFFQVVTGLYLIFNQYKINNESNSK